jgi:hypothetical protein
MRKLTFATVALILFALPAFSQNFEPAPSTLQTKLENALKRSGTIERVYLTDKENKTFEAKPGKEYFAWVVYKKSSDAVRRMMFIQLGSQGEKVKIHYPKFNQAISDADNQAFFITFTVPTDTGYPSVMYKVDASVESTIYIYEGTRGFKRD